LISATQQVNLALGNLIKLCDDVLLSENEENCVSLHKDNVKETIDLVEKAISVSLNKITLRISINIKISQNLVEIVHERINNEEMVPPKCDSLQRASIDSISQRTSLPDIPLTPRERNILEQSVTMKPVRASHSTDSILRDSSPPPKPPLPNRSTDPPPLPPKKKFEKPQPKVVSLSNLPILLNNNECIDTSPFQLCKTLNNDRLSSRSRSPEDNSDLLSTCSTDSALNHTRDESLNLSSENFDFKSDLAQSFKHLELGDNRLSFESEKDSPCSYRSSTLTQHQNHTQIISSVKSSSSNISQTTQSDTTSDIILSSTTKSLLTSISDVNSVMKVESHVEKNENLLIKNTSNTVRPLEKVQSEDVVDECRPPLPVKTRNRSFRRSQYDNVDESDSFHDTR
jgi:Rap guanine nucleotide exchange factor 1